MPHFHVWLPALWPSFLWTLPMTFPFSNSNHLFLSDKISSIFFECLHPCPHFEYCFQETHPQTSSLTGGEPIPGVLPQDLQVSKENFTGIKETYRLCSPPSVTLATPSRMSVCIFPLNSSLHGPTSTELPALLHCRANSNKKEREKPPATLTCWLVYRASF